MSGADRDAAKEPTPSRSDLRRELRRLARQFADDLIDTLDRYGVWEEPKLDAEAAELASKRVRRTRDTLQTLGDDVLAVLLAHDEPIAISVLAEVLDLGTRTIAHPLAMLVSEGRVVQHGTRRGARYEPTRRPKATKKAKAKGTAKRATRKRAPKATARATSKGSKAAKRPTKKTAPKPPSSTAGAKKKSSTHRRTPRRR
jgi:hypothetical protein